MLKRAVGSGGFCILLVLLLAVSEAAFAAIFGDDLRTSIVPGVSVASRARSVAVAVLSTNFSIQNGRVSLSLDAMSDLLCSDQKFASEPSLSFACTGFLVAPDLIATAGHCMVNTGESRHETETYCQTFSWLFDYNSGADFTSLPQENLYSCQEVVYAIREEQPPFRDYALVRLNRRVIGREPLKLAAQAGVEEGLSMIGYPFGMPAKLSAGARVLHNAPATQSFVTNLDAFEGNSGSPVFNADGEVIGILVGGTPIQSLVRDETRGCQRYNRCQEDGTNCLRPDTDEELKSVPEFQAPGSIVQRIDAIKPWLAPGSFVGM